MTQFQNLIEMGISLARSCQIKEISVAATTTLLEKLASGGHIFKEDVISLTATLYDLQGALFPGSDILATTPAPTPSCGLSWVRRDARRALALEAGSLEWLQAISKILKTLEDAYWWTAFPNDGEPII